MKIVIPGGSGQVGTVLARAFTRDGHDVVVLSRRPKPQPWRVVPWDGVTAREWANEIDGADVVLNLAGRSVNCRYSAANRLEILESRLRSPRLVGEVIAGSARPPRVWLQASTATIYAHRYDAANDEWTGEIDHACSCGLRESCSARTSRINRRRQSKYRTSSEPSMASGSSTRPTARNSSVAIG